MGVLERRKSFKTSISMKEWSNATVVEFMKSLEIDPKPFAENGVQGNDLIDMDESSLMDDLGLTQFKAKKVLKAIKNQEKERKIDAP